MFILTAKLAIMFYKTWMEIYVDSVPISKLLCILSTFQTYEKIVCLANLIIIRCANPKGHMSIRRPKFDLLGFTIQWYILL